MELSDRVTVLKKGKTVKSLTAGEFDEALLAGLMIGTDDVPQWEKREKAFDEKILEVKNLSVENDKGLSDVKGISFELFRGEILGIAGVAGNGQKALAEVLTGLRRPTGGQIIVKGEDFTNHKAKTPT
ncbi:MAG: ATP-binding cassette domain-containing protein [Geovibrio sp.]|nr:ATP-binding cassette domain-containing protein [Geovibrio sp.]